MYSFLSFVLKCLSVCPQVFSFSSVPHPAGDKGPSGWAGVQLLAVVNPTQLFTLFKEKSVIYKYITYVIIQVENSILAIGDIWFYFYLMK